MPELSLVEEEIAYMNGLSKRTYASCGVTGNYFLTDLVEHFTSTSL